LRQIEQLFLVKSNIDSNRRKTYSLASKTSSEFRDKHFCADNYFPELLQRTKLCMVNPEIDQSDMIYSNGTKTRQKISESRDEHIFLKSNIDSNRRKTYSLASKTSSEFRTRQKISELNIHWKVCKEFRDKHFCAINYFPELLQRTKLCGNDKRVFLIKR